MMYPTDQLTLLKQTSEAAITKPVERYGVGVYVDTDPDIVGSDIYIDPADTKGIEIFREFAAKMAVHYKSLKTIP
jgi:hypothetical protein